MAHQFFRLSLAVLLYFMTVRCQADSENITMCYQGRSKNPIIFAETDITHILSHGNVCENITDCPLVPCTTKCVKATQNGNHAYGCDSDLTNKPRKNLVCQKGPGYGPFNTVGDYFLQTCHDAQCQADPTPCKLQQYEMITLVVGNHSRSAAFVLKFTAVDDFLNEEEVYLVSTDFFNLEAGAILVIRDGTVKKSYEMTKRGNEIGPEMVPLVSKAHLWQGLLFGALLVLISGVMVFGFCYWKKLCCFSRLSARSPDVRYNAPLQEVVIV